MDPAAAPGMMMTAMERPAPATADFEETVRQHWSGIFRFILASVRDRDAAGSLAQDCFFKAYRARDRFRGDCSLRAWLMQIAVNLVRDHARSRRLRFWRTARETAGEINVPGREASPEAQTLAKERLRAVWEASGRLPERQRTVFLLRFVEDMDLLEIAAATGLKEGTVKAHLFRALQTIREELRRPS